MNISHTRYSGICMLSGIGIAVTIVTIFSQRRLKSIESKLKPKTEVQSRLLADETKTSIKGKIDGIEKLTEEDFNMLITMMKSLRCTLRICTSAQDVVTFIIVSLSFAAIVVLI